MVDLKGPTPMLYPLVSPSDIAAYECADMVADAFTYRDWMSCTDQLARAWGHADDFASDGMGAAASFYELDLTDLRLLAVAAAVDAAHARLYHHAPDRPYIAPSMPYVPAYGATIAGRHGSSVDAATAYVRSDDHGFWDLIVTTRAEAETWLAAWREANEPRWCDECECEYGSGDECECECEPAADGWTFDDRHYCAACAVAALPTGPGETFDGWGAAVDPSANLRELLAAFPDDAPRRMAETAGADACESCGTTITPRTGLAAELADAERWAR